jgi:hypothetical protein
MELPQNTLAASAVEPADLGGGLTSDGVGTLNLRQEVLDGFLTIRHQHQQLQALLHQVMRKVALPRCREIGEELLRVKGFYAAGKKGPGGTASSFYSDCLAVAGLSRSSVAGYVSIAQNWGRLLDYMADLPEGATPITGVKGALKAIAKMNSEELPPRDTGAVDVEAEAIAGEVLPGASRKRTSYASSTREKALPAIDGLMAAATISERHKAQLAKVREALALLLEQIEAAEAKAAEAQAQADAEAEAAREPVDLPPPAWSEVEPEPRQAPAASAPEATAEEQEQAEEEQGASSNRGKLAATYPRTAEGLADLEAAIAEAGSGAALDLQLGLKPGAVSKHRKRIRERLEQLAKAEPG